MENYVTLFDNNYLLQGIGLYKSLVRNAKNFKLWVICIDEATYLMLVRLNFTNLTPLKLSEFETTELLFVKGTRSIGEYCWTLTPFVFDFVFSVAPTIERLTYIDSDVWIRKSPQPIFRDLENSGKLVLITDHGYAPVVRADVEKIKAEEKKTKFQSNFGLLTTVLSFVMLVYTLITR